MMPGRKYSAGSGYRYGFNGKENDNEVKGEGNQQDYAKRIYDTRLGKFLSPDPLIQKYPFYSPYQFSGNDVIRCIDLEGGEPLSRVGKWDRSTAFLSGTVYNNVYDKVSGRMFDLQGVVDPWTGKMWIVADDGQGQQQYFYLVNDDGATDKIRTYVHNGRTTLYKAHLQRFETRNETDAKQGAAIARGMGEVVFWSAVGISALPGISAGVTGVTNWIAASGESATTILSAAFGDASAAYGAATVGAVGGATAYAASGEAVPVEGMLQNEAIVVRGGVATTETMTKAAERVHPSGIRGFSVESANGASIETLTKSPTVPNNQIGVTTVGTIRSAGGQVTPTTGSSPNHATVSGLSAEKATELLTPPIPNPNPGKGP